MTRVCDIGGMTGFGPVADRGELSPFHEDWERTIFGLTMCYSSRASAAMIRDVVDRMVPGHYLSAPYWERWVTGLASVLVEQGVTTRRELEKRAGGDFPLSNPPTDDSREATALLGAPASTELPRFAVDDVVAVREWHPKGHTRCPGYVQGKTGTVVRVNGHYPLPDLEIATGEIRPERTYAVRFAARTVWGGVASANEYLHCDLYESYLTEGR